MIDMFLVTIFMIKKLLADLSSLPKSRRIGNKTSNNGFRP